MAGWRRIFICTILSLFISALAARERFSLDSLERLLDLPAIGVPIVQYAPETNWVFGAAVQTYFRCPNQTQSSIVQVSGAYTLKNQWYVKSSGTLYAGKRTHWKFVYRIGFRNFPDRWYEQGNEWRWKSSESYRSRQFNLTFQPMYRLPKGWAVGLNINGLWEHTSRWEESAWTGIGAIAQYDSRDTQFYPHKGLFFSVTCSDYEPLNRHYARFAAIHTDLRHFCGIYRDLLFAWQCITQWTIGNNIPYSLLPTLGGEDVLRGLPANMFRDQSLWALQGELRFPIYRLLRGTAFASIGDVYNLKHWQWEVPKVGYGIGLRVCINKIKVNVRLDVARNNVYKSWNTWDSYSFYLTAMEAF